MLETFENKILKGNNDPESHLEIPPSMRRINPIKK